MNTRILTAVLAGVVLALAPVVVANADDTPAPATYAEYLPPVLDCAAATITFVTVNYTAEASTDADGNVVYGDWTEASRTAEVGLATGTDLGDCPEWQIVETDEASTWVYTPRPVVTEPVATDEISDEEALRIEATVQAVYAALALITIFG